MTRRPGRLVGALTLLLVGLRWIINSNTWSGPVVAQLGAHGVHLNDWFSIAAWGGALALVYPGWRSSVTTPVPLPVRNDRLR